MSKLFDEDHLKDKLRQWSEELVGCRTPEAQLKSVAEFLLPDEKIEELGQRMQKLCSEVVARGLRGSPAATFGYLYIVLASHHLRVKGSESDSWSAIRGLLPDLDNALFSAGNPKPDLYDAIDLALDKYKLRRSGPRDDGGQWCALSLRMQIGFTERGFRESWASWLKLGQPPEAVERLLAVSDSFKVVWETLKRGARGRLSSRDLALALEGSPWVREGFVDELACLVTQTPPERHSRRPATIRWGVDDEPRAVIRLDEVWPLGLEPGLVYADGSRVGKLDWTGSEVLLIGSQSLLLPIPLEGPEVELSHDRLEPATLPPLWNTDAELAKLEVQGSGLVFAARDGIEPQGEYLDRWDLDEWTLWKVKGGTAFADQDGFIVHPGSAPLTRANVWVSTPDREYQVGDTWRVRIRGEDAARVTFLKVAGQECEVDEGQGSLRVTLQLGAREWVPKVALDGSKSFESLNRKVVLKVQGFVLGDEPIVGDLLSGDLKNLWAVAHVPGYVLTEGLQRIQSLPNKALRLSAVVPAYTGEPLAIREEFTSEEVARVTVKGVQPLRGGAKSSFPSTRSLAAGRELLTALRADGVVCGLDFEQVDGEVIVAASDVVAVVVRGEDGDHLESAWDARGTLNVVDSLSPDTAPDAFAFLAESLFPLLAPDCKERLLATVRRLPAGWGRAIAQMKVCDSAVERRQLALARLLRSGGHFPWADFERDECEFLAEAVPESLRSASAVPGHLRAIIQGWRETMPSDPDELDEAVARETGVEERSVVMQIRTHQIGDGSPLYAPPQSWCVEALMLNSTTLRRWLAEKWMEKRK